MCSTRAGSPSRARRKRCCAIKGFAPRTWASQPLRRTRRAAFPIDASESRFNATHFNPPRRNAVRRTFTTTAQFAFACLAGLMVTAGELQAQPKEVEIAIIDGLTGPYSANGSRAIKGAEMAAEEINAAGGIKCLGGAKIKLIIADAGARPARA